MPTNQKDEPGQGPDIDFAEIISGNISKIRNLDKRMDSLMTKIVSNTQVAITNVWEINKEFASIGIDNIDNELRRLGLL